MQILEQIEHATKNAGSYPDLVNNFIALGIQSYTVEVSSENILYRFGKGENALRQNENSPKTIAGKFDQALTIQAIRDNQQGKTDYPGFINDIAKAGVRF